MEIRGVSGSVPSEEVQRIMNEYYKRQGEGEEAQANCIISEIDQHVKNLVVEQLRQEGMSPNDIENTVTSDLKETKILSYVNAVANNLANRPNLVSLINRKARERIDELRTDEGRRATGRAQGYASRESPRSPSLERSDTVQVSEDDEEESPTFHINISPPSPTGSNSLNMDEVD